jgi:hypothetical protein
MSRKTTNTHRDRNRAVTNTHTHTHTHNTYKTVTPWQVLSLALEGISYEGL